MDPITYAGLNALLLVLVGWLLSNKDAKQATEINLLFKKHDEDAKALADLRIEIAREHYLKHELDDRFHSLERAIKESSASLGEKFDKLAETLVAHMIGDAGK